MPGPELRMIGSVSPTPILPIDLARRETSRTPHDPKQHPQGHDAGLAERSHDGRREAAAASERGAAHESRDSRDSKRNGDARGQQQVDRAGKSAVHSADADQAKPASAERDQAQGDTSRVDRTDMADNRLTDDELREVEQLRLRDAEVRAHEQSHKTAATRYAKGGPNYDYEVGPDGKRYAVGGEVSLDVSPVPDDPAATIRKMQTVQRAALAPAEPSAQDRSVAARASLEIARARAELARERAETDESPRPQRASEGGSTAYQRSGADAPASSSLFDLVA